MTTPISLPYLQINDPSTGAPLVGAQIWSYAVTTTTPQLTYSDKDCSVANDNPMITGASGIPAKSGALCLIYSKIPVKLVIERPPAVGDVHGTVLYTIDNYEISPYNSWLTIGNSTPPTPAANNLNAYCNGTTLYYKDSTGATQSPATAAAIQQQIYTAASAGGTGDAITATFTPAITSLVDKIQVCLFATAANSTATPTFSPDGLTAKTIVKLANAALVPGDIPGANAAILLEHNAVLDKWVLLNPAMARPIAILQNRQTKNTAGGTATSGSWLIYPFNVLAEDNNSLVSGSLPAFALQAGTYFVEFTIPFNETSYSQIRLYNVTDAAVANNIAGNAMVGSTVSATTGAVGSTPSYLAGTLVVASTKTYRLEYQVTTTCATNGFGTPANFTTEVYGYGKITRVG